MMANPRPGQRVRIHYRRSIAPSMPLHGLTGTIAVVSRGRPRNHGVQLDRGGVASVPCGNLAPWRPDHA